MPHSIIKVTQAFESLRDNGYKNVESAIAELIDNSIQAGAATIEVTIFENRPADSPSKTKGIATHLYVVDDGEGMDPDNLERALVFGDGSRIQSRKGIGRFGLGLPNSSISQCSRLDAWSKQSFGDFIYSYLDVPSITNGSLVQVPTPTNKDIPEDIKACTPLLNVAQSSTCIKWSNLDRIKLKSGSGIARRISKHASRIYRKFLQSGKITITVRCIQNNNFEDPLYENQLKPTDPLFLTKNSSAPFPFDNEETLFKLFHTKDITIPYSIKDANGNPVTGNSTVKITGSHCRYEARNQDGAINWPDSEKSKSGIRSAGATIWGKAANQTKGISLVRADREIIIDTAWLKEDDPTERWWSIQIEFQPELDELFGVTNNKQYVMDFSDGAKWNMEDEKDDGETDQEFKERLKEDGDQRYFLILIWEEVKKLRTLLRGAKDALKPTASTPLNRQRHSASGDSSGKTPIPMSVEKAATGPIRERDAKNYPSRTKSLAENKSREEIKKEQLHVLVTQEKMDKSMAEATIERWEKDNSRVDFSSKDLSLNGINGMFQVNLTVPDVISFVMNSDHSAYRGIFKRIDEIDEVHVDELGIEQKLELYRDSYFNLKLLLLSWAVMTDEKNIGNKDHFKKIIEVLGWWSATVDQVLNLSDDSDV